MGRHTLDQGLDGIDTNGPFDLQPGWTPVSPMEALVRRVHLLLLPQIHLGDRDDL